MYLVFKKNYKSRINIKKFLLWLCNNDESFNHLHLYVWDYFYKTEEKSGIVYEISSEIPIVLFRFLLFRVVLTSRSWPNWNSSSLLRPSRYTVTDCLWFWLLLLCDFFSTVFQLLHTGDGTGSSVFWLSSQDTKSFDHSRSSEKIGRVLGQMY